MQYKVKQIKAIKMKKKKLQVIPLEELLKKFSKVEVYVMPPKPKDHVAKFANIRPVLCND